MPSDKRAFDKDEAGAALEPAKRPCPGAMSGDGEVKKKKKGENITEDQHFLWDICAPSLSLPAPCERPADALASIPC
jgi:hypothetical protein